MTRRKFIAKIVKAGVAVFAGFGWLMQKADVRKFLWAGKVRNYPGNVRGLGDIDREGDWSG